VALAGLGQGLEKRRFVEVSELFEAGHTVEQLQGLYGVQRSTIVEHLSRYGAAGGQLDTARVRSASTLSAEEQQQVLDTMARLGTERLVSIFEAMGGAVSYDELRLMRLVHAALSDGGD
jgi:ATP-dependent DNA helicase RecQ